MTRPAIMLLAGLLAGGVIGFSLGRTGHSPVVAGHTPSGSEEILSAKSKSRSGSALRIDGEEAQVSLGNITTVPFQELYGVLSALPPEKLDELAAQLRQLPNDKQTAAKIGTFFNAWAHIDPKAALRAAIAFKSMDAKNTAIAAVIESADVNQAQALAKAIKEWPEGTVGSGQRNNFLASAMTKWAQIAPADAAKFFDSIPTTRRFQYAASAIAQSWASADPQAALAWAQLHGDGEAVNYVVNGAVTGWWSKDHAAAEAYALAHLNDPYGRQLASHLANYIYGRDPDRAKQWVSELPDPQARQQSASMLTMQMAWSDPKGASEWALTLPADVRENSLRQAVHYWAGSDLAAAGEWINGLTGTARDIAASAYTTNIVKNNPAAAAQWAMTISDAKLRDSSLDRIASEWLRKDAPVATAWIQSSPLPSDQKQRLLALAPKR